jgi:hypothetical protein
MDAWDDDDIVGRGDIWMLGSKDCYRVTGRFKRSALVIN